MTGKQLQYSRSRALQEQFCELCLSVIRTSNCVADGAGIIEYLVIISTLLAGKVAHLKKWLIMSCHYLLCLVSEKVNLFVSFLLNKLEAESFVPSDGKHIKADLTSYK